MSMVMYHRHIRQYRHLFWRTSDWKDCPSIARKEGERTEPCLIPKSRVKKSNQVSFHLMHEQQFESQRSIIISNSLGTNYLLKIVNKKLKFVALSQEMTKGKTCKTDF